MAYNHEFPYVDPNRYNADWAINTTKKVVKKVDELEKKIDDLPTGGDVTKEDLENLENRLQPQITQNDEDIDRLFELDASTTQDLQEVHTQLTTIGDELEVTKKSASDAQITADNAINDISNVKENLNECRQVADDAYDKAYSNKEEIGERPEGKTGTLWENVGGSGGVSQEDFDKLKRETVGNYSYSFDKTGWYSSKNIINTSSSLSGDESIRDSIMCLCNMLDCFKMISKQPYIWSNGKTSYLNPSNTYNIPRTDFNDRSKFGYYIVNNNNNYYTGLFPSVFYMINRLETLIQKLKDAGIDVGDL